MEAFDYVAFDFVAHRDEDRCGFCGGQAELELYELWDWRNFQISACCETVHELALQVVREENAESAELLRRMGVEAITGLRLRRTVSDLGTLVLDWNPVICPVTQKEAKEFVDRHHAHNRAPPGWKFGFGVANGSALVGVVMVGRPVARMIDHTTTLEVNRLCIDRGLAPGLVWNACSMLYAAAAREARKRGYRRLITYTLQSESAHSLRASGWTSEGPAGGGRWSRPSRERADDGQLQRKVRWVKVLASDDRAPRQAAAQKERGERKVALMAASG